MTSPIAGWLCILIVVQADVPSTPHSPRPTPHSNRILIAATTSAREGDFPDFKTGKYDITFEESSPDAAPSEVVRRLFVDQEPPAYDIATEKFHVWVPEAYAHDGEWGLFVWVDAADLPHIPEEWEKILAEHKLLAIAAHHSGNPRHPASRLRLAIDAAFNMRRRFNINPRRVYISGLSGGGRLASMAGIAYADVFSGTFPIVGASFYKPMPAPGGRHYPPSFAPVDDILAGAKRRNRFVLLTGSKDFNRENTKDIYRRGFKAEGFRHVLYLEVPDMGHARPSGEWFAKGLDFLDRDDPPPKAKTKAKGKTHR